MSLKLPEKLYRYRQLSANTIESLCSDQLFFSAPSSFLVEVNDLSPRIVSYLNRQLDLSLFLTISTPDRDATFSDQCKNILNYLGFSKYSDKVRAALGNWLSKQAEQGYLPDELFLRAEQYLLNAKVILPGPSVMEHPSGGADSVL